MRVLHLIAEMGTGGAESLVVEMCRAAHGYGWYSAVASAGGHNAELLAEEGCSQYPVPLARRQAAGVARAVAGARSAIRDFRPDTILAHNVSATGIARLAGSGRRIPVISVFHGVAAQDYRASARVLNLASNQVVTVSAAIAARLRAAGLRNAPVVLPNAVQIPEPASRDEARTALGLPLGIPIALSLARMVRQKRHDVMLDAWSRTTGDKLLLLAGDGPLRADLEALVARRAIPDVQFLGVRHDIPALLTACDLTILSSDWEGLPIAALESLAAGRPLAASDVDGIREACAPGALLVPPREPEALAEAIDALLHDPARRQCLGETGRAHIETHYHLDTMMQSYDSLLRRHLRRRP